MKSSNIYLKYNNSSDIININDFIKELENDHIETKTGKCLILIGYIIKYYSKLSLDNTEVDAPEPATMIFPALLLSHRPAR